jgi:hypothetical protein
LSLPAKQRNLSVLRAQPVPAESAWEEPMTKNISNDMATVRTLILRGAYAAALLLLALGATVVGSTRTAQAEIIQISALAFVPRTLNGLAGEGPGLDQNGTLTGAQGEFYAAVPFTTHGHVVCRFTLVYRDFDSDIGITVRLMKKRIRLGDNPFTPAVVMARVNSGGAAFNAGVQQTPDTSINHPVIDLNRALYYVQLTLPGPTLEILGVQIDVRAQC